MAEMAMSDVMAGLPRPVAMPTDLALGSPYRSTWRMTAYLVFACAIASLQVVCMTLKSRLSHVLPMVYHRVCCQLLDIRIEVRGSMSTARPTLFVCNHSSYLDISILGSIVPGSFVAKTEVADWPFFGFLAKLQRTVFIDRRRNTTHRQREGLALRLKAGDNLILFPEGTSNDGNRTLPFRSSLFAVAEGGEGSEPGTTPLTVQPVSLAYTRLNGFPIGRNLRPYFAWYGDMDLFGHLWRVLGLGRITVALEFHPPVTLAQFGSRKALSEHCRRAVSEGMAAALAGRCDDGAAAPDPANQYT
jgi:lyso-ornithine lipid O-acyltransferase